MPGISRKKLSDIHQRLPATFAGRFQRRIWPTLWQYLAFTGDGWATKTCAAMGEYVKREALRLPDVAKVEVVGERMKNST